MLDFTTVEKRTMIDNGDYPPTGSQARYFRFGFLIQTLIKTMLTSTFIDHHQARVVLQCIGIQRGRNVAPPPFWEILLRVSQKQLIFLNIRPPSVSPPLLSFSVRPGEYFPNLPHIREVCG